MKITHFRRGRAAFTLTEVLVVITIIGALFALVMTGFSYAQNSSKRNATKVRLGAIKSGLEQYQKDAGEYPEPASPGETVDIANKSYEVSGAAMLYQALSGDGNNQIKIATNEEERSSNGSLDDEETKLLRLQNMPKDMWMVQNEAYFMVDGWGRPFQYVKAVDVDPTVPAEDAPEATTINVGFDLWSYGDDTENTDARSVEVLTNSELKKDSAKWITNW